MVLHFCVTNSDIDILESKIHPNFLALLVDTIPWPATLTVTQGTRLMLCFVPIRTILVFTRYILDDNQLQTFMMQFFNTLIALILDISD